MNDMELDHMLRAYTEFEIYVLKQPHQPIQYSLLQKVNEQEYVIQMPKDSVTIIKQSRFLPIPKHKHETIELVYMYSGQSVHTINNEAFVLSQGEACIMDTNVIHAVDSIGDNDILINVLINTEYFDPALLSSMSMNGVLSRFLHRAVYQSKEYSDYLVFHTEDSSTLHQLMIHLLRECYERSLGCDEAIKCYLNLIFLELLRVYEDRRLNDQVPQKAIITEILNFLDTNYQQASLPLLAQKFNFHPNYVSALIKKTTGHTFKDIITEKRLKHAKRMLHNTNLDIETISNTCGFTNLSFFYKKFREAYGVSPGTYRNSRPLPR